jgi:hypothetical protein
MLRSHRPVNFSVTPCRDSRKHESYRAVVLMLPAAKFLYCRKLLPCQQLSTPARLPLQSHPLSVFPCRCNLLPCQQPCLLRRSLISDAQDTDPKASRRCWPDPLSANSGNYCAPFYLEARDTHGSCYGIYRIVVGQCKYRAGYGIVRMTIWLSCLGGLWVGVLRWKRRIRRYRADLKAVAWDS